MIFLFSLVLWWDGHCYKSCFESSKICSPVNSYLSFDILEWPNEAWFKRFAYIVLYFWSSSLMCIILFAVCPKPFNFLTPSLQTNLYTGVTRKDKPRGRHHGLTNQKKQEIREAFELFDTDGSGIGIYLMWLTLTYICRLLIGCFLF